MMGTGGGVDVFSLLVVAMEFSGGGGTVGAGVGRGWWS